MTEMEMVEMSSQMVIGILIGVLIAYVLTIVPLWRMFTKAGQPGWKALIPVYSTYILYKISWTTTVFWILLIASIVVSLVSTFAADAVMLVLILSIIVYIAAIVIGIMFNYKISKSFGHGVGFTIGLIFLNLIFLYIIAFGKSEYKGPQK